MTSVRYATPKRCKIFFPTLIPKRGWIATPVMERVSSIELHRGTPNPTALPRHMKFLHCAEDVTRGREAARSRNSIPPASTGSWCWRRPESVRLTVEPVMAFTAYGHRERSKLSASAATLRCPQAAPRFLPRLRPLFHAQIVMRHMCLR